MEISCLALNLSIEMISFLFTNFLIGIWFGSLGLWINSSCSGTVFFSLSGDTY